MDRRSFLRLAGTAVASGLVAARVTPGGPAAPLTYDLSGVIDQPARFSAPSFAPVKVSLSDSKPGFGERSDRRTGEVVTGLHRLTGIRGVNTYLWMPQPDQPDLGGAILFDCGWPWSGRSLTASLAALGRRPADIRAIAVTHGDFDHVGSLAAFVAASGAEIIAHELEIPLLSSERWRILPGAGALLDPTVLATAPLYRLWPPQPVKVTRPIRDGDEIGGGWIAVHTPGHTPGHAAYFHPALRTLIAGDALGSECRGHLRLPNRAYADDWEAALRSVRRLADLQPEVVCFGHGPELHDAQVSLKALANSTGIAD